MRTTDVAVVGAGPAGIGAALAAARNGARVMLIDENDSPGGHLRWTLSKQEGFDAPLDNRRGVEIAGWAVGALDDAGVAVVMRAVAWGVFEQQRLGIVAAHDAFQVQAASIIVATGATDVMWPFRGWELPGVLTATAALRLMHLDRVLPGEHVVVLGDGTFAEAVASDLTACGARVVAMTPSAEGVSAAGTDRVEWFNVDGQRIACDAIVLAFGRQPDAQLGLQAQADVAFSVGEDCFVPTRNQHMLTSVSNLYVAGDAGGIVSAARAFAEGAVAGAAASGGVGLEAALDRLRKLGVVSSPALTMPSIDGDTLVCRCEEVAAHQIRAAIDAGSTSLNDLKRRTRAGMGICQGIYCHRAVASMLAERAGIPLAAIVPMTARPPARPIPMAAMADLDG